MASVALDDATVANSTSTGHITYRKWEYQYTTPIQYDGEGNPVGGGEDIYDWNYYTTDATVTGKCNASSNSVYIDGKNAVLNGDTTTETDQYTVPSGEYYSGAHSSISGSVTSGNSKNVFIGGRSVSINGSTVSTHAPTATTINQGNSTVFIGG